MFLFMHLEQAGNTKSHLRLAFTQPAQAFRRVSLRCTITTPGFIFYRYSWV